MLVSLASSRGRKLFGESARNKQFFLALCLESWMVFEPAGDLPFDTLAKVWILSFKRKCSAIVQHSKEIKLTRTQYNIYANL